MFRHILIPTDGSPLSASALDKGMRFARDAGAKVTVIAVTEPFHVLSTNVRQIEGTQEVYERQVKAEAASHLADAAGKARELGVPCDLVEVENEHPYRAIIETATGRSCDLIAMASHGRRGISAVVIGSQTVNVLTHSAIPVLVYR